MNHLDLLATEAAQKMSDDFLQITADMVKPYILTALTTAYNSGKVEGVESALAVAKSARDIGSPNAPLGYIPEQMIEAIRKLIEKGEKA